MRTPLTNSDNSVNTNIGNSSKLTTNMDMHMNVNTMKRQTKKKKMKMKMDFFGDAFGFEEQGYHETKEKLLQVAKFHRVPSQHADYFREQCDFDVPGEASVTAGIFSMPSVRNLREHANRITSDGFGLEAQWHGPSKELKSTMSRWT